MEAESGVQTVSREPGYFKLEGPLVFETVASLFESLPKKAVNIRIDLQGVTELDSSALALFLHWQRQAQALGANLQFLNASDNLNSLITLYNLKRVFPSIQSTTNGYTS